MKEGLVVKDLYNHIQTFIEGKSSSLAQALVKNIGFGVSRGSGSIHMLILSDWYRIS